MPYDLTDTWHLSKLNLLKESRMVVARAEGAGERGDVSQHKLHYQVNNL